MVRCKFRCISKTESEFGGIWDEGGKNYKSGMLYGYKFYVVTSGSQENKMFFASTPTGTVEFQSVRNDSFTPGREYYLDFSEAQSE